VKCTEKFRIALFQSLLPLRKEELNLLITFVCYTLFSSSQVPEIASSS
jgi:hypothetical protein